MQTNTDRIFDGLQSLGISHYDARKLILIGRSLQIWNELLCQKQVADTVTKWVEVHEETGGATEHTEFRDGTKIKRRVVNAKKKAIRELNSVLCMYPSLTYFMQHDPRACPLYIVRKDALLPEAVDPLRDSARRNGVAIDNND